MRRRGLWAAVCLVLLVGVGVLAVGAGYAKDEDDAGPKCSEATLHGTYLFAYDGFEIKGNDKVPFSLAGYEVRNGNGKVSGVFSANFNGNITRNEPFSGTYTVKADCTGISTFPDGTQFHMFAAPDGSMFTLVQTNPEFVTSGTAKRVGD
jgi:hypothetical protein